MMMDKAEMDSMMGEMNKMMKDMAPMMKMMPEMMKMCQGMMKSMEGMMGKMEDMKKAGMKDDYGDAFEESSKEDHGAMPMKKKMGGM